MPQLLLTSEQELNDFAKLFRLAKVTKLGCNYSTCKIVFTEGHEEHAALACKLLTQRLKLMPFDQRRHFVESVGERLNTAKAADRLSVSKQQFEAQQTKPKLKRAKK